MRQDVESDVEKDSGGSLMVNGPHFHKRDLIGKKRLHKMLESKMGHLYMTVKHLRKPEANHEGQTPKQEREMYERRMGEAPSPPK